MPIRWPWKRGTPKADANQRIMDGMARKAEAARKLKAQTGTAKAAKPSKAALPSRLRPETEKAIAERTKFAKRSEPVIASQVVASPRFVAACEKLGIQDTKKAFDNAYRILREAGEGPLLKLKTRVNELRADTLAMPDAEAVKAEAVILARALSVLIEKGVIKKEQLL